MSLRMEKINKEMIRQITQIIQRELDDPMFGLLSITRVDTTSDLKMSKVYFSVLDESQSKKAQVVLDKMSKFIRFNLGKKIRIKVLPELKFIPDDSIKYSVDIYRKIEEIKDVDKKKSRKIDL